MMVQTDEGEDNLSNDLLAAIVRDDDDAVRSIWADDPSSVNRPIDGVTPMVLAAQIGSFNQLELLFTLGANPGDAADTDGMTPLFALVSRCSSCDRIPCLHLLASWGGVDLDAECDGTTVIEHVGRLGDTAFSRIEEVDFETITILVGHGATLEEGTVTNVSTRDRLLEWGAMRLRADAVAAGVLMEISRPQSAILRGVSIDGGSRGIVGMVMGYAGLELLDRDVARRIARCCYTLDMEREDEAWRAETHAFSALDCAVA